MNILYTLPDLHFGGSANLLVQNISCIAENHKVYVIYFGANDTMYNKFISKGVKPIRLNYNGIKDLLSTVKKLRDFLILNKIDVVHSNLYLDKLLVAVASINLRLKKVTSLHSADISKYNQSLKNKLIFKIDNYLHNSIYDKTVVVSDAARMVGLKERKFKPEKLEVVLNGIPPLGKKDIKKSIFNDSKNIILGTACRFQKIKGLHRLLLLFSQIREIHNLKLILIGDGPLKAELEALIIKLDLLDHVYITGFTDHVPHYLNQLHYYINSSYSEALPVSVLEALSIGKPIIASNVGGLPEIVANNKNGILIDFDDISQSNNKLNCFLFAHSRNYNKLSERAVETFFSKFSSEIYCSNLMRVYNSIHLK